MEGLPAVIKVADMPEDKVTMAIKVAMEAKDKYTKLNMIAAYIKKELDKNCDPNWHCCVGDSFGSYVTHETGNLLYFFLKEIAVLIWKAG